MKVPFGSTARLVSEFSKPRTWVCMVNCITRDSPGCMGVVNA